MRPGDRKAAKKGYYWPVPNGDFEDEDDGAIQSTTFKMLYFMVWRGYGKSDAEIEEMFRREHPNYIGMEGPVLEGVEPDDVGIVSDGSLADEVGGGHGH